jgi:hypothetical protein
VLFQVHYRWSGGSDGCEKQARSSLRRAVAARN